MERLAKLGVIVSTNMAGYAGITTPRCGRWARNRLNVKRR